MIDENLFKLIQYTYGSVTANLSDVAKISSGPMFTKAQLTQTKEDIYPVYFCCTTPTGHYKECNAKKNTPFIVNSGSAGDVGIAKDDSFFTSRVYWIESDYIFPKYLYYFLLNKQEFLHSKCVGLIPSLSKKVIENLEINIPPKEKQMEIVNKLESFENQYIDSFDKINKKEKKFVEDMIFEKYLKKLK